MAFEIDVLVTYAEKDNEVAKITEKMIFDFMISDF